MISLFTLDTAESLWVCVWGWGGMVRVVLFPLLGYVDSTSKLKGLFRRRRRVLKLKYVSDSNCRSRYNGRPVLCFWGVRCGCQGDACVV